MRPLAYYNENDKFSAAWLRELMKAGLIADGEVDERSIVDVRAEDLKGFTQCHFFAGIAGIGVWSYALRCAGVPDSVRVWTGSCPCQPWSTAGKRKGFQDERHLWPSWFELIRERCPELIFGEQVGGNGGRAWLAPVRVQMESLRYAVGSVEFPASGIGAFHIRQRLYFVAESSQRANRRLDGGRQDETAASEHARNRENGSLAEPARIDCRAGQQYQEARRESRIQLADGGELGDSQASRLQKRELLRGGRTQDMGAPSRQRPEQAGATFGFWSNAEWLYCRDDKYRPVEPGTFPLAHGAPARVGRLRGYGNALCAPQAEAFIRAYIAERLRELFE